MAISGCVANANIISFKRYIIVAEKWSRRPLVGGMRHFKYVLIATILMRYLMGGAKVDHHLQITKK